MGLGGFIIGGLASGIGKGMQMQHEQNALERREARLAAMRQAERAEDRQWKREDDKEAERRALNLARVNQGYDLEKIGVQFGNTVALTKEGERASIEKEKRDEARTYRIEAFRSQLGLNEAAAGAKIDAQKQRILKQIESGDIEDILTTEDGTYVAVTKGGQTRPLGYKAAPTASGSGSSLMLPNRGPTTNQGPSKPTAGLTYTREELEYTARKNNIPVSEVEKQLRAAGYKPAGS